MKFATTVALVTVLAATASFAEGEDAGGIGDPAAGEKAFSQCRACHVVADGDGNVLAGRNARSGPNLFGMIGRQAATVDGFRYSRELAEAGQQGLVWDADTFVSYTIDPVRFLRTFLDDGRARGKMTFKVRKSGDAEDLYAFLNSLGPAADTEAGQ
ncbi:MAG: cytochrome C [Boseongicola sp.]|nr:cytochrome C [Boseongicola sp.]